MRVVRRWSGSVGCDGEGSRFEAGVLEVAEGVAEEVDAEDGEKEGGAGEEGDPGSGGEEGLAVGELRAPGDRGRLGAQPQEAQTRLGDHVAADADRGGHDDRAERVRQDVAAEDRGLPDAARAGGAA